MLSILSPELQHALKVDDGHGAIDLIEKECQLSPEALTELLSSYMRKDWREWRGACCYSNLGTWRIIIHLLKRGARETTFGNDLIFVAFRKKSGQQSIYIIEELKKLGFDINARWSETGRSLMAEAFLDQDINTIKKLFELGVNIDDTVLAEPLNDTSSFGIYSGFANRQFLIANGWTTPELILRMMKCCCVEDDEISALAKYIPINTRLSSVNGGTLLHFLAPKNGLYVYNGYRTEGIVERIEQGEDMFALDNDGKTFIQKTKLEKTDRYTGECKMRFTIANAVLKRLIQDKKINSDVSREKQIAGCFTLFGITPNWFVNEPDP